MRGAVPARPSPTKATLSPGVSSKGDVVEHLAPVDCLAERLDDGQQVVADLAIHGFHADIRITAGRRRKVPPSDRLSSSLLAAGRLLMLAGLVSSRSAAMNALQFLDFLARLALLVDHPSAASGRHLGIFIPEIVVADVHLEFCRSRCRTMWVQTLLRKWRSWQTTMTVSRIIQQELLQPA